MVEIQILLQNIIVIVKYFLMIKYFRQIILFYFKLCRDFRLLHSPLTLPLPMAQLRWQERVGGVFLCGDWDVRFGVSINFPHCMVLPLRMGRDPPDCPVGGLTLSGW